MENKLVLMATDRDGWCFDHIANAIQRELSEFYRFKTMRYASIAKERCDILVSLVWERALFVLGNTKCSAMVPCVYDHLSWKIDDRSRAHFLLTLKNSAALAVCNERILEDVKATFPSQELPKIFLLEDGVDTKLFNPTEMPGRFSCGWTGMSNRCTPGGPDDYKGLAMLRAACIDANAEFRVLDGAGGGLWPHKRMPVFYQDVSVQLIGSAFEGTPNPLLEAMAMSRPVITTDVGLASKLVREGENGFIVPRDKGAFAEKIKDVARLPKADLVAMGRKARRAVEQFSWEKKSVEWRKMIDFAALGTEVCRQRGKTSIEVVPAAANKPNVTDHPAEHTPIVTPVNPRAAGKKPRVLLISDVPDWAFHQNMKDLELSLSSQFDFTHWFVIDYQRDAKVPDMAQFDSVFCVYHRWNIDNVLPWDRTVGSLRAYWFFPEDRKPVGNREYAVANRFRAFHVVTQGNYEDLKAHCPGVVYLTNPVNMDRFPRAVDLGGEVIASWNGNAKHRSGAGGDIKGFHAIVKPACEAAGVKLEYAEYNTNRFTNLRRAG